MPDEHVRNWLAGQEPSDISSLLQTVTRSNLHPYGFRVHRLFLPELQPWEIRMHIWPEPVSTYGHMAEWGTEGLSIHAHGWSLLSRVLVGSLEEYTYRYEHDAAGRFTIYSTRGAVRQSVSRLRPAGRASFGLSSFEIRRPETGVYGIPTGTFHSTLPGEVSVSLVATDQQPGQVSEVAGFKEDREDFSNPSPELPGTDLPDLRHGQSEWSSSFVFFVRSNEVLLARTRISPEQWQPVGGRRDGTDSSPLATLVREVREEVGVTLLQPTLKWLGTQPSDGDDDGTACFWTAPAEDYDNRSGEQMSDELLEVGWWKFDEAAQLPMYDGSKVTLRRMLST